MRYCNTTILTIIVAMIVTLFSCENKWPMNGDLDGQWQLMRIDNNGTGKDVKAEKVYWNFQLHMLMVNAKSKNYYAHFEHKDGRLRLCDISFSSANEKVGDDNVRMSDEEIKALLSPFGIDVIDECFYVLTLSDESLTLRSGDKVLTFRKF